MSRLTTKELHLLDMVQNSEEIQFYFLRKVKGLKWFDEFEKRGFLEPKNNPVPQKKDKDNLYSIPTWDVLEYLLKTADEFQFESHNDFISKYLDFIKKVTRHSQSEKSNYRTWWYFSQILIKIPPKNISTEFIEEVVSIWLKDKFNTSLVIRELGLNLIPSLVKAGCEETALSLLNLLTEVKKSKKSKLRGEEYEFIGDSYQTREFLNKNVEVIGELGISAIKILEEQLSKILSESKNDEFSNIWRPAIPDHDQNEVGEYKPQNILITSIRDGLTNINNKEVELIKYVQSLLSSDFLTLKRIAIHEVQSSWPKLSILADDFLTEEYFDYSYRYELFHFLKSCFENLNDKQQQQVLDIISKISSYSDEKYKEKQIAFGKLNWLVAIKKSSNTRAIELYRNCIQVAGKEPENPDFSFYSYSGFIGESSALDAEEFYRMTPEKIVQTLNDFKEDRNDFNSPTERGLADEFLKAIRSNHEHFYNELDKYLNLNDHYLSKLIDSFAYIRDDKVLDEAKTFKFCLDIVSSRIDLFKAEYSFTITAICKYIVSASKNDSKKVSTTCYSLIESTLEILLREVRNEEYVQKVNIDPVMSAINSDRGKVIEALINYTLYRCRIENKKTEDHKNVWGELKKFFEKELKKTEKLNFEFHAIVAQYLPNMLYISKEWVGKNKEKLFSEKNYTNWLAAINGFSYSNYVDGIFEYLVVSGQFHKILDSNKLKYENKQRFVKYAGINYLISEESDAISVLFERWNDEELSHLVWFMWTLRDKSIDKNQKKKILQLWKRLSEKLEDNPLEKVLSNLSMWIVFLNTIDDQGKQLLMQCAPHSDKNHHTYILVEELKKHVDGDTDAVAEIFLKMLKGVTPDYDKKHICYIVEKIYKSDQKDLAEQISQHYLKNKYSFVTEHLSSIKD